MIYDFRFCASLLGFVGAFLCVHPFNTLCFFVVKKSLRKEHEGKF